jgi:hypothetical protein
MKQISSRKISIQSAKYRQKFKYQLSEYARSDLESKLHSYHHEFIRKFNLLEASLSRLTNNLSTSFHHDKLNKCSDDLQVFSADQNDESSAISAENDKGDITQEEEIVFAPTFTPTGLFFTISDINILQQIFDDYIYFMCRLKFYSISISYAKNLRTALRRILYSHIVINPYSRVPRIERPFDPGG